jgi:hypothetical protein
MPSTRRARVGVLTVVAVLAIGLVGTGIVRADPSPSLPPVEPSRLLVSMGEALDRPPSVSGEVLSRIDLGVPSLPSMGGGAGAGAMGALASVVGEQRWRIAASREGVRIAHLMEFAERTLVMNADAAWWWDSQEMRATQLSWEDVPVRRVDRYGTRAGDRLERVARRAARRAAGPGALAGVLPGPRAPLRGMPEWASVAGDPLEAARSALRELAPVAEVTVDGTARVAGRPVYELVLTPRADATKIGAIVLSVDEETRLPMRVAVIPRGSEEAAIELGFTSVSFEPIDPAVFAFEPPRGATVERLDPRGAFASTRDERRVWLREASKAARIAGRRAARGSGDETTWSTDGVARRLERSVRVFGRGFEGRVAMRLDGVGPAQLEQMEAFWPYDGPLMSAMTTTIDGSTWVLVGPVPLEVLAADAASLA